MKDLRHLKQAGKNPWFNIKEAAAHTGLAEETLRQAARRRQIRTSRRPSGKGKILIRLNDLELFMRQQFPVQEPITL